MPRLLKRLSTLLALAALVALAACSSVTLAYKQFPLLAGLWANQYLDLDSAQRGKLKEQLLALQSWHRREELPQWLALLRQAQTAFDDGRATPEEWQSLERGARASLQRTLQQAGPMAAPLLASLRPEQWQHLQKKMDEKSAEWRERNADSDGPQERAKRYVTNLERWLGDLDRTTRQQARTEAHGWRFDLAAMSQARATRQARTIEALRAWSRNDLAAGNALFLQNTQPLPGEQAYRDEVIASTVKLLNGLTPEQRAQVRQHWADWTNELRSLQAGQ